MPTFRAAPATVRVPASSANLGPGFDACGLALGRWDVVAAQVTDSGLTVEVAGEGEAKVKRTERNLVVTAMRAAFDAMGGQPRGLALTCANRIPHGKGLGSSAAAVVAGLCAARELTLGGLADDEVLRLATDLEGHPDNVAACLHGGYTIAWYDDRGLPQAISLPVVPGVRAVLLLPASATTSTAASRAVLPDAVARADAALTAGRAALLTAALTRDPALLLAATEDRLHQPARLAAAPRTAQILTGLRERGVPAVLSGSGPAVLVLARDDDEAARALAAAPRGWAAEELAIDADGATVLHA